MTPAALLEQARAAGVTLTARDGGLVACGRHAAVAALMPLVRAEKAQLLALLGPPPLVSAASHLSAADQTAVLCWLADIGESDPTVIIEILALCAKDTDARRYYLARATEEADQRCKP